MMKRKFILTLGFTSLLCSNAFAMETVGGHLISHQEVTTGTAKVTFKESDVKDNGLFKTLLKQQLNSDKNQFIDALAQARNVSPTTIGTWVHLSGFHRDFITNRSSEAQTYAVRRNLCVVISKSEGTYQMDTCASSIDTVTIDPAGFIGNFKELELNVVLSDPNVKYYEHSQTIIFNEVGNTIFSSSDMKPIVFDSTGK
ncbi:MAG: hypothetical protein ACYCQI_08150 [Gammaproteobacteria bacterium]